MRRGSALLVSGRCCREHKIRGWETIEKPNQRDVRGGTLSSRPHYQAARVIGGDEHKCRQAGSCPVLSRAMLTGDNRPGFVPRHLSVVMMGIKSTRAAMP